MRTVSQTIDHPTQQQSGSAVVDFASVSKIYEGETDKVWALRDVSLRVGAGEFLAFVGKSGCGKSTLLNLAGAMDFPTSGEVHIDGVSTRGLSDSTLTKLRRDRIGFIFQSFQLLHTLSVEENVQLPLLLAGAANTKLRVADALQSVELQDLAHRMPHQLSGGQMQRVAIARAMVLRPKLLLADEPTGNLDTSTGQSVMQLLRRLCDSTQTTILMATHSLESAEITDAVIRMRDGQIDDVVRS